MVLRGEWQSTVHKGSLDNRFHALHDVYWMLMPWIEAEAMKLRHVRNKLRLIYGTPVPVVLRDME